MSVVYCALIFSETGMGSINHPEPMFTRIASFILSIVVVYAYFQLLTWKKSGYFLIVATATINALINLALAPSIFVILSAIIPIVVLYLVLQVTKDGVSCWSQLA